MNPREPILLQIERELATSRRAIYRAIEAAERGGYMDWEDDLTLINNELHRMMMAAMRRDTHPHFHPDSGA